MIDTAPEDFREMLLGPLLSKASVHSNTAGVFKGFYKNRETKIGQFGGTGSDALVRIKGKIVLEPPVLSRFECDCEVLQEDANGAARRWRTSISRTLIPRITSILTDRTTSCSIYWCGTRAGEDQPRFGGYRRDGGAQGTTCGRGRCR